MSDTETLPAGYYGEGALVTDWSKYVDCNPDYYLRPQSLAEMQSLLTMIAQGAFGDKQLRFLGGQHSCSDIFSSEVIVDPTGLPLEFDVQPLPGGGGQVTASAFMHAHEFLKRAADSKLSLTALGGTDAQTMAGLISTNTAGATVHTTVYEGLQWVEYLAPGSDGTTFQTQRISVGDASFNGIVASLGAVGFMTRVCFNLVPELYFTGEFKMVDLDTIVNDLQAMCDTYEFWRFEWLPQDDKRCLRWTAVPYTPPDPSNPPDTGDYPLDTTEALLRELMEGNQMIFKSGPFTDKALALAYKAIGWLSQPMGATGPMRNIIPCDRKADLQVTMAEWSFDPKDLPKVLDTCRSYFGANHWPNLPIEIECTKTDQFWMSPWNWPGLDYIVKLNFQYLTDFLDDAGKAKIAPHLDGMWKAFEAAGIPFKAHWGKLNSLDPDYVSKNYDAASFMPLVAPMFLNPYLQARLPQSR